MALNHYVVLPGPVSQGDAAYDAECLEKALSVEAYLQRDGYQALKKVMGLTDQEILDEMIAANLNGRGGASFLAGNKWRQMYRIESAPGTKFVVCNGDEGEPGTFKDKQVLLYNPMGLIEGMTIAGRLFKSRRGFIYIRGEYRKIQKHFEKALQACRDAGYLGNNILGDPEFNFDIQIVSGAGAYECGESSALMNSIEGKAGRPRIKPPHLAEVGLYSQPTLLNNVESYANVPVIFRIGAKAYTDMAVSNDGGTRIVSISGHAKNRGAYEVDVGTPIGDVVEQLAGGTRTGRKVQFVHIGGQSGAIAFPEQFGTHMDYNSMRDERLATGSAAFVVMDDSVCLVDYCRKVMEFFNHESCGKCNPCRIGVHRTLQLLTDLCEGRGKPGDIDTLEHWVQTISKTSQCGLGQSVNKPIMACLRHRRDIFEAHTRGECYCGKCKSGGDEK